MKLKNIHRDSRGETYSVTGENLGVPEIALFFTKENHARGGCIHSRNEYFCVISGDIVLVMGDDEYLMTKGDAVVINSDTPHYYISKTDSVVIEWNLDPKEKNVKYNNHKEIVDRINVTANRA